MQVDVSVISPHFSFYRLFIFFGSKGKILITLSSFYGFHRHHPKGVRICADGMKGLFEGDFYFKSQADKLVYYEIYDDVQAAILREKQLKKWRRPWKLRLIEKMNPAWNELYDQIEP